MCCSDCRIGALFDLSHTLAAAFLDPEAYPWEALDGLSSHLVALSRTLGEDYRALGENIFVHKTARISPSACLTGPCILGAGTEVRQGAFLRGGVLVGEGCVVGNSVELKNCILFDGAEVPHFNYVGDSILGRRAHLGAGAVTSNLKADRTLVFVHCGEELLPTGRKKVGAFLGDFAEVGCNAVLCPGTVVGRMTRIYPLVCARGTYPPRCIVKGDEIVLQR